ncbi:MAG TPA: diacylglycerol kinase family protein [Thermoanaerobaculia bacterium]|nr:diacylglycerol kinase family protein [Thermoanaerobaculia bacterium]
MKATLFLNRSSGAKLTGDDVAALAAAARESGVEIIELSREIDCSQVIRDRVSLGTSLFIAAGGDGTVHHVMQAVVNTGSEFGVIPTGTYNHFARDLGIPLEWPKALEVALTGERRQIDTARINDRYFVNNVSIGLYPEVVVLREERGRDYPRWKARLFALYTVLRRYPHVTIAVEADNRREVLRTHVFMVSNNSYDLGRVGIEAPRERLTGGHLSVYWLPHVSRWALTRYISRYLAGRVRTIPGFRSFRTLQMKVQSTRREINVGIDGEVFAMQPPLVITTVPQSLTVRVPATKEE